MTFDFEKVRLLSFIIIVITFIPSNLLVLATDDVDAEIWWQSKIDYNRSVRKQLSKYDNQNSYVVAVIDSGIDFTHPDLRKNQFFNQQELNGQHNVDDDGNGYLDDYSGWDFVNDDNNTGNSRTDPISFHGTFIAGLLCSKKSGLGLNVKLMSLRILNTENLLGTVNEHQIAMAINYAVDHGADIINFSVGLTFNSTCIYEAIKNALAKDIIVVAPSGNYSPLFGEAFAIPFPARYPETICVGATDSENKKADYSNFGGEMDCVAPVGSLYTVFGEKMNSTDLNKDYRLAVGTSFAVPQVIAILLILKIIDSDMDGKQAISIVKKTCTDLGENGWDSKFGYGMINIDKAIQQIIPIRTTFFGGNVILFAILELMILQSCRKKRED